MVYYMVIVTGIIIGISVLKNNKLEKIKNVLYFIFGVYLFAKWTEESIRRFPYLFFKFWAILNSFGFIVVVFGSIGSVVSGNENLTYVLYTLVIMPILYWIVTAPVIFFNRLLFGKH